MSKHKPKIKIARAYDPPETEDGCRVLVDRLWPRGVKKEDLKLDDWLKELAPSDTLRKWFDHDVEKWDEFRERYRKELDSSSEAIASLLETAAQQPIVLLYAAKDEAHNNAVVLKEFLEQRLR
ncbi:hypothetical protein Pla52o_30860 [Novipirellula galeiformis]|uniref:DUF488 domain-containing protein n=1 Tax=Novipirellula galeiformis TaxID=2528004 RepID=A0A5C6CCU8_9BACT|nr:DUF488 domain-containing protein [Novipirellula galeiformis]TWU22038.1 hypothetical protein Pla52o_30860 [Novipirellula galeiformis]